MIRPEQPVDSFQKFLVSSKNYSENIPNFYAKDSSCGNWSTKYSTDGGTNSPITSWTTNPTGKSDERNPFSFQINVFGEVSYDTSELASTQEKQPTPEGKNEKICEVLEALRDLMSNYDETNEQCMSLDIKSVEDAYFVVNLWPNDVQAPIVDIDEEGYVCLYIFAEDEFSRAGIEFFSKEHMATYVVLHNNDKEDAESGYLDTQTEVIKFFERYRKHWME